MPSEAEPVFLKNKVAAQAPPGCAVTFEGPKMRIYLPKKGDFTIERELEGLIDLSSECSHIMRSLQDVRAS